MPEEVHTDRETFLHKWFEEVWNQGNEAAIDQLLDDDVVAYGLTDVNGETVKGKEDFKAFFRKFRSAVPDIHVELGETMCDGDRIAAVCHVRGVHSGGGLPIAANNSPLQFSGILMVRLKDGKIAEAWNYFDFMTMFEQMGALSLQTE